MTFRIVQALIVAIAFLGWIIYQMAFRKKRFSEIKGDTMAVFFFIAVWMGLYYWLIS